MKKILVVILSLLLVFTISACRTNRTKGPDVPSRNSNFQSDLDDEDIFEEELDEELFEDIDDTDSSYYAGGIKNYFLDYNNARLEFGRYVIDNGSDIAKAHYLPTLTNPELDIFDYLTPLFYWGETLDDNDLAQKEEFISMLIGDDRILKSIDLERKSDNMYRTIMETHEGDISIIDVEYNPDKDALRLVAEHNGEQALIFEYAKTSGGYASQFYYYDILGGTYGNPIEGMCVYRIIFAGNDGSFARFDHVEEPASIMEGAPDEQEFIEGATHWLTVKNGKYTGNIEGEAF